MSRKMLKIVLKFSNLLVFKGERISNLITGMGDGDSFAGEVARMGRRLVGPRKIKIKVRGYRVEFVGAQHPPDLKVRTPL